MKKIQTKIFFICFLLIQFSVSGQSEKSITGTVQDDNGVPLAGATVLIKGKSVSSGASSDFDGKFTIQASNTDVLLISYLGYITQEFAVGNKTTVSIVLQEDASLLDEIVVVGYGSQKKAHVTGAVSSVKVGEILQNRPTTNVLSAIQGVVPGFQITTSSGQPGSLGVATNIRGFSSINGGTPLFLLDNVEVTPGDFNPQDIESVTVLKDVSSSSIYGARAAFGVVLLTSKKGSKDKKPAFNYSLTSSISRPEDLQEKASTYDFINALNDWGVGTYWTGQDIPTWVDFVEENRANPGLYPNGVALDNNGTEYFLSDNNLWDEFFGDMALSHIHNFSVSGGSKKITYRVSTGYSTEDGTIVTDNDSYRKSNINAHLNIDLTDNIISTTKLFYLRSKRKNPIGGFGRSITYPNFAPVSGNHVFEDGTELPYNTAVNWENLLTAPETLRNNFRVYQKFEYTPIKGLNLSGAYTFERRTADSYSSNPRLSTVNPISFAIIAQNPETSFYKRVNNYTKYNALNLLATYKVGFNNHNFKATIGNSREEKYEETIEASRLGLINTDLPSLSQATGTATVDDSFTEWAVIGYFGRLNYNFDEKYFLEGSIRADGSSRFPKKDKFASFVSFSGGWNVAKEEFMENIDFINSFKLRASFGEIGNQNISPYSSFEQFGATSIGWIGPETGIRAVTLSLPGRIISPSFTWERVQDNNFGLDASFFNNKLTTNFDYYIRDTIDMLTLSAELPDVLGAGEPLNNAADLQTKGWEVQVNWKQKINNFSYNIGVSLSDSQSEITKFENESGALNRFYVGKQIGEIWGFVTDGFYTVDDFEDGSLNTNLTSGTLKEGVVKLLNQNPNPGDIKFKDLNGDGGISPGNRTVGDPGDKKVIGNNRRRYQYGIFGNVAYKNFDLNFLFNGVGKRDIFQDTNVRFPFRNEFENVFQNQLDYWTPENTDAFFPRIYSTIDPNYNISRSVQTKYLLNGAYFRLKSLTIGYNLPTKVLKKHGIDKLRLFAGGENLFNWDKLPDGTNTELENLTGGNGATYPFSRMYSLGLNLQF